MSDQQKNPTADPSAARLAANRENAQKSSGPKTPEGKAISSLNAVKCGLTGANVLFATDDVARYHAHIKSYEIQFQPVGPEEYALVQSIADIRWRLNRIPGLELTILAMGSLKVIEELPHFAQPEANLALELEVRRRSEKELRNLHLQENRLARRRERESAELERRQAARKAKEEENLAIGAKAALLASHRHQEGTTTIPGLGFVFSRDRFTAFMNGLKPAQRQNLLHEALAETAEEPPTMEAAA